MPVLVLAGLAMAAVIAALMIDGGDTSESTDRKGVLQMVAERTTTGRIDDHRSQDELKRRVEAGERVYITCGPASRLAQRMLAEAGVESRLVTTLTRHPFNGVDDGHTMVEVRERDGWALYDLDNNRQAIDADGNPVDAPTQILAGGDRRWRVLSEDQWIDFRGASAKARRVTNDLFIKRGLGPWYNRVLGVLLVETPEGDGYVFNDAGQRKRVEAYSPAYHWVDAEEWKQVLE